MTRHPTFGATLGVDWQGGTAYVTIGQCRDIGGPSVSRNEIEVPGDHDQPDNYLMFFAGLSNAGELTFPLNLDPSMDAHVGSEGTGLLGSFEKQFDGTALPRWQYQNGAMQGGTATFVFRGYPTAFEIDMGAVEGSMSAEVTIKISGKPTLTVT